MTLDSPLTAVKGVGPQLSHKLQTAGIDTIEQLLRYYPRRYDDFSQLQPIAKLKPGPVTIQAVIKQVKGHYVRRGMHVTEAVASDASSSVRLVWFNQPYRSTSIKADAKYYISGQFELRRQRLSIINPSMELVSDFPLNTARIVPVYREVQGLKSTELRRLIRELRPLVDNLTETLPDWLRKTYKLIGRAEAVMAMHFPPSAKTLQAAQYRLGFEEVFAFSLSGLLRRQELLHEKALVIPFKEALAKAFVSALPFTLTDSQRKAVWRIYQDMQLPQPMNRLLEGDVGSGKTVVATMAALMAMEQGFQVAFMAPTELLARQHAATIHDMLKPLGYANQVGLLVGSLQPAQKRLAHQKITSGELRLIVGTHALIQDKVAMQRLGLVIVDEQHRFGVEQRRRLQAKAGHALHVLHMTATPIPRSLALTLYGELAISILATKPVGRKPIITKLWSPNSRQQLYTILDKQLSKGRQMFVVCPLISPSEHMADTTSATEVYGQLKQGFFKHRRVGLLHGQLKAEDKQAVMEAFIRHELDILVSTTVIEVGVDVPNATIMLLENAERFGLAQIHQLRGRVGRSDAQGYCYLMLGGSSAPTRRLRAVESSNDGFALAELDLEIRGPGAIYGTLQHGPLDLQVAKLTDTKLVAAARQAAESFLQRGEDLLQYKQLYAQVKRLQAVTNLN